MRIKDIVQIAFRNLAAGKQMVKKMIFGMVFVVMILFCFFMILESYDEYIEEFNSEHTADCYYYISIGNSDLSYEITEDFVRQSENLKQQYNADNTSILCTIEMKNEEILTEAGNISLYVNGIEYKAKNYYTNQRKIHQDIRGSMWPISFALYKEEFSVFSETIIKSFKKDYMIGDYPLNQGEIMLDTYILEVYGIENRDELLGSIISIYSVDEENNSVVFENYKLTGIFQGDLISSRESTLTSDNHLEHIYVNVRQEDEDRFRIGNGNIRCYFNNYAEYVRNYKYMTNLLQMNIDEISEKDINLTGHGMEYYILYWIMENLGKLLLIIAFGIGLIITVSVLYVFQFYRDRNARYISMLQNIGMTKKDRMGIFSVEMSMIVFIASVIGVYLSVIFLLLFNVITGQVLNFTVVFDVGTGIIALLSSWIYFAVCLWFTMRKKNRSAYSEIT